MKEELNLSKKIIILNAINSKAKPRIGKGIGYHEEEFNLSECIIDNEFTIENYGEEIFLISYVKEFIKNVLDNQSCTNKECICCNENRSVIAHFAGDKFKYETKTRIQR